ncbi:type 1 fimbrial protein (plasmid) [Hafnia alvei]|uniref:fimbrial protein n=1 Tax=Hafnia alvei TaxID=569 RepID=UPI0016435E8B|nr:fimbrial protein [Hafnia alvei]MBI0278574.1 type 1 fimbrial protein [Hafnia alvei]
MKSQYFVRFMAAVLAAMAIAGAGAADGTISFTANVVDATCSVAPESKDMIVDFGKTSLSGFNSQTSGSQYTSVAKTIVIKLLNCPESVSKATITLSGASQTTGSGRGGLLPVSGSGAATGVVIFFDAGANGGAAIQLNTPFTRNLVEGDNTINMRAYLGGTGDGSPAATAGTITATAQYSISYQ